MIVWKNRTFQSVHVSTRTFLSMSTEQVPHAEAESGLNLSKRINIRVHRWSEKKNQMTKVLVACARFALLNDWL